MFGKVTLHEMTAALVRRRAAWFGSTPAAERHRTIVIVGASFAGYYAARFLALGLSPYSRYRVVIIEPNSHFQFSWVLPRYCVASGHEHKAFIPYGGHIRGAPQGSVQWVRDRVIEATKASVKLEESGEMPYDYLVIATGSGVQHGLPSRVNDTEKLSGMKQLQAMQTRIKDANRIVIAGGGAAGVELAADAKDLYPEKKVVLVHSRSTLMHRFGECLQDEALKSVKALGVEIIFNDRVVYEDTDTCTVSLESGRVMKCDFFINCTGQKPSSDAFLGLSPSILTPSGHIKIKPTLQIADDSLPNVYVCGDVADTKAPNTNAFIATCQGGIVADNILLAVEGKAPRHKYEHMWLDNSIKLTLGLHRSVMHFGVGLSALNFELKVKEELMAAECWTHLGERPYKDASMDNSAKETENA
ncbi:NAD(P)/FAD-dependent oxidoreductase [Aspergillus affinis]|uniref:NAD(P)/FAD-dependent oxidoreductase n=1 Tax=Aspergillus affinis TaxID=1070780 RepID=UPI0022FDD9C3|nr:uncharacterized protein KD926_003218 [Aspergillus affinis]KAI9035589.1 hypothetical protein KD926_003218 [Aspergillus affinis]